MSVLWSAQTWKFYYEALRMNLPTDSKERKEIPVVSGVLDYFPLAIAAVARVSYKGNEKHNPGQPLHWARSKSADHIDCVGRHLLDRDAVDKESGETELAHAAWRILAVLQLQQEKMRDFRTKPLAAIPDLCEPGPVLAECCGWGKAPRPLAYISGPMRGYVDYNFPAFDKAKAILSAHGFEVISPADMDREQDQGKPQSVVVYVDRDYTALRRIATENRPGSCVVTLHGYERSTGAIAETAIAKWLGINIRHIAEFQ